MFIELKRDTEKRLGVIQDAIYAGSGSLIPLDEILELVIKTSLPEEVLERIMEREYG